MSIGKNIKNGGAKKSKESKSEKEASAEVVEAKVVPNATSEEENATEVTKIENEKLQEINESVSALTKAPVETEANSIMIADGQNMLIVFPVGNEEYAISIDDIREVVPTPPIALIPQVPAYILGVANVRGNVLAVVDLSKKFSSNEEIEIDKKGNFVLVIKSKEMHVAVNVVNVPNTMIFKDSEIDAPTNVINHSSSGLTHIKGIIKKDKRMIIWIDIHEVMAEMELDNMIP